MEYWKAIFVFFLLIFFSFSSAIQVTHDGRAIVINGDRKLILSGSIHYPRSTPEMWPVLIQMAKAGGLNAIETYVFWDIHEPQRGQYDFNGNRNIIRFLKTIQDAGLYVVLRLGPYVCAEWNYGGLPVWLHQLPGIQIRTDNKIFEDAMSNFTTLIVNMINKENLWAPQGGPIILAQIENEYGNVISSYGDAGKKYLQWTAQLAESFNISIPWIMCQEPDAPQPMINTCNGFYCDEFTPNTNSVPKMWTENWVGWFKSWGEKDPHRPAEDVAFAVARFFQRSGTFQNYYMYHGGTNFGRSPGGPYVVTTYDYDAPIDEYGNRNLPKWGHLKQLHELLYSMERVLLYGDKADYQLLNGQTWATIYTLNGTSGCFLSNTDGYKDYNVSFQNNTYHLPAWSVSILPTCKEVVYNTATVTAQTSLMVKKPNTAENDTDLVWLWLPEDIDDTISGEGTFTVSQLLEQNNVTGGNSDYLWYMTSVSIRKHDPIYSKQMILRVHTMGHGLHVFFNGNHVGSSYSSDGKQDFVLEVPIKIKHHHRTNHLALLSSTVGLKNYGPFFDMIPTGIAGGAGGSVELIGNGKLTMNLSTNPWTYKVGLNGEINQIWAEDDIDWQYDSIPIRSPLTWYKTTFSAPLGNNPVVVNLQGLQKGEAWVNGHSIGRFWPTILAPSDCEPCWYGGPYDPKKCATGCGLPTQNWYHVPRSILKSDNNSLVLLEEMGGSPFNVNFQTVTVGTVCAGVPMGDVLELECASDSSISSIEFASLKPTNGTCGSYVGPSDGALLNYVQQACMGQTRCSIPVTPNLPGGQNGTILTVQAVC
ncbi:hypothetical protein AAC387_Pa11g0568 [Persea americana]